MINTVVQIPVISGEQIFPDLYHLTDIDKINGKQTKTQYFVPVPTNMSTQSIFYKNIYIKDRKINQLYQFINNDLQPVFNALSQQEIIGAQLFKKENFISISKRQHQVYKPMFSSNKQTITIYESQICQYDNFQIKFTMKTKHYHKFYFLNSQILLIYEKQKISVQLYFEQKLKTYNQILTLPTNIIDLQCYDNHFVILYPLQKSGSNIIVLEYFECDNESNQIVSICKLTSKMVLNTTSKPNFQHYFNKKYFPVSLIFLNNQCHIFNFVRRENLVINLPMQKMLQDVYNQENYMKFKELLSKESNFSQFLNFQIRKWQPFYLDGLVILTNPDLENNKLHTISILVNELHRSKILYTNILKLISYEPQEIRDYLDAIPYIAHEQHIKSVSQAIKKCNEYISVFYIQKQQIVGKKKSKKYSPFITTGNRIFFDFYRQEYFDKFDQNSQQLPQTILGIYEAHEPEHSNSQTHTNQSDDTSEQSIDNIGSLKYIQRDNFQYDLDNLQLIIERFQPRVLNYIAQNPEEESSCITMEYKNQNSSCEYHSALHNVIETSQSLIQIKENIIQQIQKQSSQLLKAQNNKANYANTNDTDYSYKKSNTIKSSSHSKDQDLLKPQINQPIDLLKPLEYNEQFHNYNEKLDKIIKYIPVPQFMNNDEFKQLKIQFRFFQLQCSNTNYFNELVLFDYYLQQIVVININQLFNLNIEQFDNILTAHFEGDQFVSYKHVQDCMLLSFKRQLFFEGQFRCGYLGIGLNIITTNQQYWIYYANQLQQYDKYANLQVLSYLLVSKVQVNLYASAYLSNLPYVKSFLELIHINLLKLMNRQQSFIMEYTDSEEDIQRRAKNQYESNPQLSHLSKTFQVKKILYDNQMVFAQQEISREASNYSAFSSESNYFLPESDGKIVFYQQMPLMHDFVFFDKNFDNNFDSKIRKLDIKLSYQRFLHKQLCVDIFRLNQKPHQLCMFQNIRLLFEGNQYRNLIYNQFINNNYQSIIFNLINAVLKLKYVEIINQVPNNDTFNYLSEIIISSITSCSEYLAQAYKHHSSLIMILGELLENCQCSILTQMQQSIEKMCIQDIHDIHVSRNQGNDNQRSGFVKLQDTTMQQDDLFLQLQSFGIINNNGQQLNYQFQ